MLLCDDRTAAVRPSHGRINSYLRSTQGFNIGSVLHLSCVCLAARKKNRASFAAKEPVCDHTAAVQLHNSVRRFCGRPTNQNDYFKNSVHRTYTERDTPKVCAMITTWHDSNQILCQAITTWYDSNQILCQAITTWYDSNQILCQPITIWHDSNQILCQAITTWLESKRRHSDTISRHIFDRKLQQWELELCRHEFEY